MLWGLLCLVEFKGSGKIVTVYVVMRQRKMCRLIANQLVQHGAERVLVALMGAGVAHICSV